MDPAAMAAVATASLNMFKKCRVCGDKALGFNFNGLSCESCKIFFRRNAFRREKFTCRKGNCEIDLFTRKCCQKCRLDKCFDIGMRKELIRSKNSKWNQQDSPEFESIKSEPDSLKSESDSTMDVESIRLETVQSIPKLQSHELELMRELEQAMSVFALDMDLKKGPNIVGEITSLPEVFNHSATDIRSVIRFCKQLEAYRGLKQDDQLIMLRTFFIDIQSIRGAFMFSFERDGFPVGASETSGPDQAFFFQLKVFGQWRRKNVESFFRRFVYALQMEMENDDTIRNLIIALQLYKHRDAVSCPELLRYHYHVYQRLLRRYLETKYTCSARADRKYSTLMLLISELGHVEDLCREIYADFKPHEMIEVVAEIFQIEFHANG